MNLTVVAVGLFGISEIIASIRALPDEHRSPSLTLSALWPSRAEWRRAAAPTLRGGIIGSFLGALPGTGPTIASFISYVFEKRISRRPTQFGRGAVEGLVAPESANNAAAQTAFIPTLTLGVPGSATMAVILGALMIHGIPPGPRLLVEQPELFWGLVASFLMGNLLLLILNIPLIGLWVRLLRIPYPILYPTIVVLICVGVFSINHRLFDVWAMLLIGVVGYLLRLQHFPHAPFLMGFVLGPPMEEHLRRAMLIAHGDPLIFLERPASGAMLALGVVILITAFRKK